MAHDIREYMHFIDGEWVSGDSGESLESLCPGDNEVVARIQRGNTADVDRAVAAARKAFDEGEWSAERNRPGRAELLRAVAAKIREKTEELANLESLDAGKTVSECFLVDVPKTGENFDYYADLVSSYPAGEVLPVPGECLDFTLREPIGVCGSIVPWNFPLMFFSWKVAPALAAGNTVVYKPAELTSVTALEMARIFEEVGAPPGVMNVVTGTGEEVGASLAAHMDVDKISFTGSTEVGRLVTRAAASNLKRITMELGGKSPHIVFDDADLEQAVGGALLGIFFNQGETCSAGSRLLLHEKIHDAFVERLVKRTSLIRLGHPTDWNSRMGPVISREHQKRVLSFIETGKAEGAELLTGGGSPEDPELQGGCFVSPTLFAGITPEMTLWREEIFGPVLCITKFSDEDEAVSLANDSCYGLAAGVWTQDIKRGLRMARRIRSGMVWVNNFNQVDSHTPFGGCKQSGYGKDLGKDALLEYTQVKNVYIELGDEILCPYE